MPPPFTSRTASLWLSLAAALIAVVAASVSPLAQGAPKATPDTPFKLMTFETGGRTRIGLVLGTRVFDIEGANQALVTRTKVAAEAQGEAGWRCEWLGHGGLRHRSACLCPWPSPTPP